MLAHVRCNGTDAGAEQVRQGMAWVFVRYARPVRRCMPSNRKHAPRGADCGLRVTLSRRGSGAAVKHQIVTFLRLATDREAKPAALDC